MKKYSVKNLEAQSSHMRKEFENIRHDWIDLLYWSNPYKVEFLLTKNKTGMRNNNHIIDPYHILSKRAFVSGFMEGNTSSTRQWGQFETGDDDLNKFAPVREFLQTLARRVFKKMNTTNLYKILPLTYEALAEINTGVIYIDELPGGKIHHTPLDPGTYYLENDFKGDARVLVREFQLTVRQLVHTYGRKVDGKWDWSIFSKDVKTAYQNSDYGRKINVVEWCGPNEFFDADDTPVGNNRPWVCLTYEVGGYNYSDGYVQYQIDNLDDNRFLRVQHRTDKPFIAPKNASANNFAYGQTGPMLDALGIVKSLNKKAVTKDILLDFMTNQPMQGPASLMKSYRSLNPGDYVPLTTTEMTMGGLKPVRDNGQGYQLLDADVSELHRIVGKLFYEDYLLFMANNPKTRTAREVDVIEQEKQLIAGPLLQSMDHSLNVPLLEYYANYVLRTDPSLDVPDELRGRSLQVKVTSVFAQVQRAADLPQVDRFVQAMAAVAQINPRILDKVDFDKYADIYDDRLYLPVGLNRDQSAVDAEREKQQAMAERNIQLEQAALAAKAQSDQAYSQNQIAQAEGV